MRAAVGFSVLANSSYCNGSHHSMVISMYSTRIYADFKCEKRKTTDDRQNIASNIAFLTPLNQIITIITLLFLRVSFVLTCMCSFYLFLVRTVSLLAIFFISLARYFYQIQKICRTFFQNDCFQFYSIEVGMQL